MNTRFAQVKYFFLFLSLVVGIFSFLSMTVTYAVGVYSASYPTVYAKCALVVDATQSDCEALLDIYYGTRGTGWTVPAQLRWAFSGDATQTTIGDWAGIITSGGRVWSIYVNTTNMSGVLVSTINDLTGINTLFLYNQPNLRGIAPTIANKPLLQTFSLWGTKITGPIAYDLTTNTNLTYFELTNNSLLVGYVQASNLSTNPKLSTINLQSLPLMTGFIPTSITSNTGITKYTILGTNFIGGIPTDLSTNKGLIDYYFGGNPNASGNIPSDLTQNTGLQNFYVVTQGTAYGPAPTDLTQNKALRQFQLANTSVTGFIPNDLTQNKLLQTFWVQFNPNLSGYISSDLTQNTGLVTFNVSFNPKVSGILPSDLTQNKALVTFQIQSQPLITGGLSNNLTQNKVLQNFTITNNTGLVGTMPTDLTQNTGLTTFSIIGNTLLTGGMPTNLSNNGQLINFYVYSNPLISGPMPTNIATNTKLSAYYVYDNPNITGPLTDLTNGWATSIRIRNMPLVKGNIPNTLPSLKRVQSLDLSNLGLTGSLPANIINITGSLIQFYIQSNNLDRTSANNAILTPIQDIWYNTFILTGLNKSIATQGDITAPILAVTTGASIASGSSINTGFTYQFSVNEASFATGVGGTTGMTVIYTGCSGLVGSPTALQVPATGGIANITASINISGMVQGLYTGCFVGVVDRSGNVSNYLPLPTFTKDTILPVTPTIISPTSGSYRGNTSPTLVGTGEPGTIFTIRNTSGVVLGTGIVSATGSWSKLITLPGEGLYNLNVTLTDAAGNVSAPAQLPLNLSFSTITITAPTLILNGPITDTIITLSGAVGITATNVTIAVASTVIYSDFICVQTSVTVVTCTISIDDSGNLTVRAPDNQGNTLMATQNNYVIDTIPPQIPTVGIDTQSPRDVNNPSLTIDSRDNHILDRCEVYYKADDGNGGTVTGGYDIFTSNAVPFHFEPVLDPDELTIAPFVHEILTRCYDVAGNFSDNVVKFPPIITFLAPVTISNMSINGVQVQITSPQGNDLDNIQITAGDATLGTCVGSGSDLTPPYASPAICDISIIGNTTTVAMSAEDVGLGAVGTNSQMFIIDTTAPVVTVSGITLLSGSSIIDTVIQIEDDVAIHTGDISVDISTTANYSNFICTQVNGTQITCTVSIDDDGTFTVALNDVAGNTITDSQAGYIIDTVPPVVIFSDDIGSGSTTGEYFSYFATDDISLDSGSLVYGFSIDAVCNASDTYISSLTGDVIVTESHNGEYICIRAMDVVGNYGYAVSAYPLFVDITAPVVTLNSGSFVTIAHGSSYTEYGASRTDNVDGSGTNVVISGIVNTSVVGIYTIEYRYTDHAGNVSTIVTRTVNVTDQTPPVTTLIGGAVVTTAQGTGYADAGASRTDNVDGNGTNVIISGAVDTGTLGTYILEYWYIDMGGNISNIVTRTVHVTDQTPPIVTLNGSGDITIAHGSVYSELGAEWTDNVDGAGPAVILSGSVDTNVVGIYVVEYIYVDAAGNTGSTIRTIRVTDQTPPVVTLNGSGTITVAHGGVYNESGATWTDNVDGAGPVVILSGSVDTNVVGTYVVEYIYVDAAGNTGSVTRTVNVTDQTPPAVMLNGGSAITIVSGTPYDELGATWTDNVDGTGVVIAISGTVNTGTVGTYFITYSYTDQAGNVSSSVTRTVNVIPATVAGGGGGSNPTKDNCPNGDYSVSYYDGKCGAKQPMMTGDITTGINIIISTGTALTGVQTDSNIEENACGYPDYTMESFLSLKTEKTKRKFIVCRLYTNKQTIHSQLRPFNYDRVVTREEASRMIGNFVKQVLKKDPMRKSTDPICRFKDLGQATSGLIPYIKQSCEYGVFNGTSYSTFVPHKNLNQAYAIATVLRSAYGYQDETGEVWFAPYTTHIQDKNLERRGFSVPTEDLMSLQYKGMTRGNLGEFMYRVAVDVFKNQ